MTTYFVTRHTGAIDWAKATNLTFDVHLEHLTLELLQTGDTVIGTLPINMVYTLGQMGVRYIHLSLQIPENLRGVELSLEQLTACQASLEEFVVHKIAPNP